MKKHFYTYVACAAIVASAFSGSSSQAQGGVYFREGFETSWPTTAADAVPLKPVDTQTNGIFYTYGGYRTTGATGSCVAQTGGASHLRFANLTSVVPGYTAADSAYILTPLVSAGIFDLSLFNGRASRRLTIYKTTDTDPATTNWVEVQHLTNTNTACQEFTVAVNDATARRLKIVARSGTDSDIDSLVMRSISVLPMRMGDTRVQEKNGGVVVEWTTFNERSVKGYQVQRSTDGINFINIGFVPSRNSALSDYSFTDNAATTGSVFYRIKGIDLDGRETSGKIVGLSRNSRTGRGLQAVNPAIGRKLDLQLVDLPLGAYTLSITSSNGQIMNSRLLDVRSARLAIGYELPSSAGRGIYLVKVEGQGTRHMVKVMVE